MSGFDPGPDWKELGNGRHPVGCEVITYVDRWGEPESFTHVWVREAPVPPLPTEPYTVIRVEWKDGQPAKEYALIGGRWGVMRPDELAKQMAGFDVLAEPRKYDVEQVRKDSREAAVLAVIARVRSYVPDIDGTLDRIAREFGAGA